MPRIRRQTPTQTPQTTTGFQNSEYYESLLKLKSEKPTVYSSLSQTLQAATDHYLKLKRKAELNNNLQEIKQ